MLSPPPPPPLREGADSGAFDIFMGARVKFPTSGHLVKVTFPKSPLIFLTQQTILDVKIPTLGELHHVKFLCLQPWGLTLTGA